MPIYIDPQLVEQLNRAAAKYLVLLGALAEFCEKHGPAIQQGIQNLSEPLPVGPVPIDRCSRCRRSENE